MPSWNGGSSWFLKRKVDGFRIIWSVSSTGIKMVIDGGVSEDMEYIY